MKSNGIEKKIVHRIASGRSTVDGVIPICIYENEYVNAYPFTENECDWLEIEEKNINFDVQQTFELKYRINVYKISGKYARSTLVLDETAGEKIIIEVYIVPDFTVSLDKYCFLYSDEGIITVVNNTEKPADISAVSKESFIKFHSPRKKDDKVFIPFEVKVPIITRTQAELSGKPCIEAFIEINFSQKDNLRTKKIKLTAGTDFS